MKNWLKIKAQKINLLIRKKNYFQYFLILLSIGMVGNILFSLLHTDLDIYESLSNLEPLYILLAIILGLVPWLTNSLRVLIWLKFLNQKISFKEIFNIVIATELGSAISPTAIGGGYVKMGMLIQKGLPSGQAVSLMTLGSVEDAVFFLMAIPAAALWTSFDIPLLNEVFFALKEKLSVVLLVACCLLLFIIILKTFSKRYQELFKSSGFINKVTQKITNIWQDFSTVYKLIGQKGKIWFLASLFLTSIQWICRYSVISALLAGLSLPVDIVKFFLFQWLVFTLTTFIPSPGGAGGAETAFFYIFSGIIPRELLALTTTAWRFLTFYFQLSLGSIVFGYTNFKKLAKK